MVMHNMHTLDVLFVILPVLAVLWLVFRRRTGRISRSRAPRPWHPAVRIVCGVLGIGLLIALSVGTWREVRGGYDSITPKEPLILHLPAKPTPKLPTLKASSDGVRTAEIKNGRLLLHLVFFRGAHPVYACEQDVVIPQQGPIQIRQDVTLGKERYTFAGRINKLMVCAEGDESKTVSLLADWNCTVNACFDDFNATEDRWFDGRGGTGLNGLVDLNHNETFSSGCTRLLPQNHWSLLHGSSPTTLFRIESRARLVEHDDPLKPATLTEVADSVGTADHDGIRISSQRNTVVNPDMPPVLRLINALGVSSIILLFAAIMLAQIFVRRGLAFAGMLALCLGYAAALDRMAVEFHARKLADKQQPMEDRVMAAEALSGTYFYKDTARRAAEWPVSVKP